MKKIITFVLLSSILIACQSEKKEKETIVIGGKKEKVDPVAVGKRLFKGKGKCFSCHLADKKSIGPSLKNIITVYQKENGDLLGFLNEEKEPIVDPETFAVMKTNYAILRTFSEEEKKALVSYMQEIGK